MPLSVLIIGCGSIGGRHLRCFLLTGRARVTACDSSADRLERMEHTYHVPIISDWTDALKDKFDAVVICTPAHLHVEMALRALHSGRHVLVEKPLSHSFEGVDDRFRARAASGCHVSVAYIFHMFPFLAAARTFLSGGQFGPVRQATATSGSPFHLLRPTYAQTYYRDRRTGGGAIQDALTHMADWVESVLGPTECVMCDCAHLVLADVEVEDTVHDIAEINSLLVQ